jgi:ornithine cyclodeaminase/alanine dehydrogenase-like protein (mu-crystallin family)
LRNSTLHQLFERNREVAYPPADGVVDRMGLGLQDAAAAWAAYRSALAARIGTTVPF